MVFLYIALGLIALGIIIFRMGGKELDKRLNAVGGIANMYSDVINALLKEGVTTIPQILPSQVRINGVIFLESKGAPFQLKMDKLCHYQWDIKTMDGKNLWITFVLKEGANSIIERKTMQFPISPTCSQVHILATLHHNIEHKEVFFEK